MSQTLLKKPGDASRPTIYCVAKAVGVSVSTVSHILNHPGKYRYSKETQQKVWDACNKLRYSPNAMARSLANQTNPAIGLVCDSLTDVNITRAVDRVVELATQHGRHVVVTTHPETLPWTSLLNNGKVDWVIVLNQCLVEFSEELLLPSALERIIAVGPLPNYVPHTFGHQIAWDTTRNAVLALDHLIELGHREIAILAGNFPSAEQCPPRLQAAAEHARARGITAHWISCMDETRENVCRVGRLMTQEVLEKHPGVTALYCRQDYHAIGAYQALSKARRRIPEDMAIVGNFNLQDILQPYPSLTSIDAPLVAGAEAAMEFLARPQHGATGMTIDLTNQIKLIVRQSTVGDNAAGH